MNNETKVQVSYSSRHLRNLMRCKLCGSRFDSGGIEYGFRKGINGTINPAFGICPDCMAQGTDKWPEILRAHSVYLRTVLTQRLEAEAAECDRLAETTFILPSQEEIKALEEKNIYSFDYSSER